MKKKTPMIGRPVTFRVRFAGKNERIVLASGESVTMRHFKYTDEGFAATAVQYRREGNTLLMDCHHRSRCCDGLFESWDEYSCPVSKRHSGRGNRPTWALLDSGQRDHYAEAMGY